MSKATRYGETAARLPIASKQEAIAIADLVKAGYKTMTRKEAEEKFHDAADVLDLAFKRMDANHIAMLNAEVAMAKNAKIMIQRCKDYAGQIGDAMARIDKIVVRDFEQKLSQLERFVTAMKELDDLKRSGRLDSVISAFKE